MESIPDTIYEKRMMDKYDANKRKNDEYDE